MNGHPDNPGGAGTLGKDAVNALAAADPNFPWADYDIEDQGDVDGDGNVLEPDGVVDHLVLVHAGEDKSGGGGAQGVYAIWAHSSAIAGRLHRPRHRHEDLELHRAARGLRRRRLRPRVRPRPRPAGPVRHLRHRRLRRRLLGPHDHGLALRPDLPVAADPHGPLGQVGARLGRPADPQPGRRRRDVKLGQTSRTPAGTKDGIKINLPHKVITAGRPAQRREHVVSAATTRTGPTSSSPATIDVPAGADARFWIWNNYVIEEDWDFGFIEVSTDGGTTWTEQKVYDEADALVSTDDGYADPNGRMHDYGDKKYGLTGDQRRLAARLRRPGALRRPDHPAAAALRHRRRLPGARLVRRRLLGHRRRRHRPGATTSRPTATGSPTVGTLHRHHRRRLASRLRHADRGALLPGRVAQLRRLRQGPAVRLRHDLPPRRVEGREDQVQRARACWSGTATPRTATSTT